ncbi:MAG: 4Fe-4S binding protein [Lachnospiraceae bacterium]|nr:4Fe-4S binding protein [Lachnospiraceae bacterium]
MIGKTANETGGYTISGRCDGCGKCLSACPQSCIDRSRTPAVIDQSRCLHCGSCMSICPAGAVRKACMQA